MYIHVGIIKTKPGIWQEMGNKIWEELVKEGKRGRYKSSAHIKTPKQQKHIKNFLTTVSPKVRLKQNVAMNIVSFPGLSLRGSQISKSKENISSWEQFNSGWDILLGLFESWDD